MILLVLLRPAKHGIRQSICILPASSAVIWTHPSLPSTQSLHPHSSQHDRDQSTLYRDPEPETEMTDHRGFKQTCTISEGHVSGGQCQSRLNNVSAAQIVTSFLGGSNHANILLKSTSICILTLKTFQNSFLSLQIFAI